MVKKNIYEILKEIILEAGNIVLCSKISEIEQKTGAKDIVTNIDKKVQDFITSSIKKAFDNVGFLCEENFKEQILDYYNQFDYVFVIDPIDGTSNFSCGYNNSVISIACVENNETIVGLVYNPYTKEFFHAIKGEGAFLNEKKIFVTEKLLNRSLVGFGISPYNPEHLEKSFKLGMDISKYCLDIRRIGTSALQLCYIACGRTGLYYELALQPWDFGAGYLIVQEAGGIVKNLNNCDLNWNHKSSLVA